MAFQIDARSQVSQQELLSYFMGRNWGAVPAELTMLTTVGMNKGGNPFYGRITKISKIIADWGFCYQDRVNCQREKEGMDGDFLALPLPWGERVLRADGSKTPLITHKGEYYLQLHVREAKEHKYLLDGAQEVGVELFRQFLPKKKDGERQGVDAPIIVRTYKLSSIVGFVAHRVEVTMV